MEILAQEQPQLKDKCRDIFLAVAAGDFRGGVGISGVAEVDIVEVADAAEVEITVETTAMVIIMEITVIAGDMAGARITVIISVGFAADGDT